MLKIVRNTAFTALALVLTAVGLNWNQEIARERDPVAISQAVLAKKEVAANSDLPLEVEISRPNIKLNQYQTITIKTAPRSSLEIITVYPNGSINNPQTLTTVTDNNGHYELRFKLDNWHYLGLFRVIVTVQANSKTSRVERQFVLQTWSEPQRDLTQPPYIYPLLP